MARTNTPFQSLYWALINAYKEGDFEIATTLYENQRKIDTQLEDPWVQLALIPNPPSPATIGSAGEDHHDGIFQIQLHTGVNSEIDKLLERVDAIAAHFTVGSRYQHQDQQVIITACGRSAGRLISEHWYQITVTIDWRARVKR